MPRFVDTNVLLYAVSTDSSEIRKRKAAETLFDARDLVLSEQLLGEFYVQTTRPTRQGRLTHDQAAAIIASMARYPVLAVTYGLVQAALQASERHQISCWDAAILAAARASRCEQLLSEDLSEGRELRRRRVVNPFGS